MTAKTEAERQKALRERRKAAAGGPEVRGVYAPTEHHARIRVAAMRCAARLRKEQP